MKKAISGLVVAVTAQLSAKAQMAAPVARNKALYFVSDTQQPMLIEKLFLKPNHNLRATAHIFNSILAAQPSHLFMLGDVVALGYAKHKWKNVDRFLDSCKKNGTNVCGILGNHEVLARKRKGEANFQKRFPMNVKTGYVSVADSIAVVLLNSNFNKLTAEEAAHQKIWYQTTLQELDTNVAIKAVIVCCHHAPFSNSKVVKSSQAVQTNFVPAYLQSKKAQLFITGHAHAFEHFNIKGKDFVVIGGGGGLHQPLLKNNPALTDEAVGYKPMFHYLSVQLVGDRLIATSHFINNDFSGFSNGYSFATQSKATIDQQKATLANEEK